MKLEVGMYVRTKKGCIYKLSRYEEDNNRWISFEETDWYPVYESLVKKASHNIIDLIGLGDYINGSRVVKVNCKLEYIDDDSDTGVNEVYDGIETEETWIYFEHEINSIVTREQFESIKYSLEG